LFFKFFTSIFVKNYICNAMEDEKDVIKERIEQFLAAEKMTAMKFAEIMEIQPSNISHFMKGRNKPNFDFISRFFLRFPEISPDWFINGQGNMYRDGNSSESISKDDQFDSSEPSKPLDLFSYDNDQSKQSVDNASLVSQQPKVQTIPEPQPNTPEPPAPQQPETNPEPQTVIQEPPVPQQPEVQTIPEPQPNTPEPPVPQQPETNPEPQTVTQEPPVSQSPEVQTRPEPQMVISEPPVSQQPEVQTRLEPQMVISEPPVPQQPETKPEPQTIIPEPPVPQQPETKPEPQTIIPDPPVSQQPEVQTRPEQQEQKIGKLVKIVMFYDDLTFVEYNCK